MYITTNPRNRRPRFWPGTPTRRSQTFEFLLGFFPGLLVLLGITLALLLPVIQSCREAHRLAEMSAQFALLKEAGTLLEEHFKQHGSYPASLESLAFPADFDHSMLSELQYESDGKRYSLVARSAYDGEEYMFKDGQVQLKEK
jgi:hypothetical protein